MGSLKLMENLQKKKPLCIFVKSTQMPSIFTLLYVSSSECILKLSHCEKKINQEPIKTLLKSLYILDY